MGTKDSYEDVFAPFVRDLIHRMARQTAVEAGRPAYDREDLAQDLHLHVWERRRSFDPDRGEWGAFARTVIERKARSLSRHWLAECRDRRREFVHPEDAEADERDPDESEKVCGREARRNEREAIARIDVSRAMRRLTPRDRVVARLLMRARVSDVSEMTGIPRTTLYNHIARIRKRFIEAGLDDNPVSTPTFSRATE